MEFMGAALAIGWNRAYTRISHPDATQLYPIGLTGILPCSQPPGDASIDEPPAHQSSTEYCLAIYPPALLTCI